MPVFRHGGHLDHAAAQIALQQLEATRFAERGAGRPQDAVVLAGTGAHPAQLGISELGLLCVFTDAAGAHGQHVIKHQAGVQQLPQHIGRAACGLELVHVGAAIGVHPRQQRHHVGQGGKVVPVDGDTRRAGHGHPVDQVVGRATRGQQCHHGIHDAALVHHVADGCKTLAAGDAECSTCRLTGQLVTQQTAWRHKRGAGHMQAHGFEQHLVAVGRAVKGAGAGCVVSSLLGFHEFCAAHQPLGRLFAHLGFGVVRQAAGHGPGGHKHGGQMAEVQRTNQQAGHDLVAHTQHQRGVEHVVAQ